MITNVKYKMLEIHFLYSSLSSYLPILERRFIYNSRKPFSISFWVKRFAQSWVVIKIYEWMLISKYTKGLVQLRNYGNVILISAIGASRNS